MDCDVAPVDQRFPEAYDDVKVTEPPAQNVNGPLAEIVGATGGVGSVKATTSAFEVHPLLNVIV